MRVLCGARASRPLVSLAAAALAALAGGVSAIDLPKAVPVALPAGTTQELVFFTADGPVRVRFGVTLGGKPAPDLWNAAVEKLFAYCDKNGDGVLDEKERATFATRVAGFYSLRGNIAVDFDFAVSNIRPRMPSLQFPDKAAKVDLAGLREAFVASGAGPVGVNTTAPRGDSVALSDALFKYLDTDKDGMLSAKELAAARAALAPIDVDEDEAITADELLGRSQNRNVYLFQVANLNLAFGQQQPQAQLGDILFPQAGQPVTAKDILAVRDADKDGKLTAQELGCDPKALARLDADGNGTLDADELTAWLRQPPDLDLKTDLTAPAAPVNAGWLPLVNLNIKGGVALVPGARSGPPVLPNGKARFTDRLKPEADGTLGALLPDMRMRFGTDTTDVGQAGSPWQAAVEALRGGFAQLAGDTNELTRKQVEGKPELAGHLPLFDLADRNQDGKLTAEELNALVAAGDPLRNCRVVVSVADLGRGLFELLDRDDDGRLSPRELAQAPALLARLDRNGDGKLSRDELPRGVAVTAQPASLDLSPGGQAEVYDLFITGFDVGGRSPQRPTPVPADVPEWFRAMDRNGDGDVSAREFTGPAALFKKIDTDGDGLISPAEARAFEQAAKK